MSYWRFAGMIATSTLVMFGLMYLNTFLITHVFFSETRTYMAILMGAAMAIIMLAFMLSMYSNKTINTVIFVGAAFVFAGSLWLVRSQVTVGDVSFMRAMIPHHSIAIMTSSRAKIDDVRVRKLADEIIYGQDKEIAEMRYMISQIEENGEVRSGETEAAPRIVSLDEALASPNVETMDAGFLTDDDISQLFANGPSCVFRFTTQSLPSFAVGDVEGARTGLVKIDGDLVKLEAGSEEGLFQIDGLSAFLSKLGNSRFRADARFVIELRQGLTAGYDGFSDCPA
ncbi:DUF305 domain-containing protein [Nitratireductor aquibiodomus]|uniref:DUF305 domain-containing protein n=1 Tax=Nitratireductor aquibiodomus TaxID=204799 RepID=UPI00046A4010|nr:DUF305 domain-containing protein [Nitratireductor aquibiodomus]